jgi:hypothetical protein
MCRFSYRTPGSGRPQQRAGTRLAKLAPKGVELLLGMRHALKLPFGFLECPRHSTRSSLRRSASWSSSGVASWVADLCLDLPLILISGSRPRMMPLVSLRILPISSIRGRTWRTSSSSLSSSLGVCSAASIFCLTLSASRTLLVYSK